VASWISSEKISARGWSEGSVATIRVVLERGISPLIQRTDFGVGKRLTGAGSAREKKGARRISPLIQRTDFGVGKRLTGAGSAREKKGARRRMRRNWASDFMEILEVGYEREVECGELRKETKSVG